MKEFFRKYKPGVPRRYLLLVAGGMWLFAGGFLEYRGEHMLPGFSHIWLGITAALVLGLAMYFFLFLNISFKHISRILSLQILKPCIFSFFDLRGYLMMALMIGMGVALRLSGLVDPEILGYFYIAMGIPLLLSALRFFAAWARYRSLSC